MRICYKVLDYGRNEEISAMIIETECAVDDMNLFTDLQTQTYKDVRIYPELTDDQRTDVLKVLEEFQDVFSMFLI